MSSSTASANARVPRAWMWAQLLVAWLPLWAMFTAMIVVMHGNSVADALVGSGRMIAPGALLGVLVYKFAARLPWPHPFRLAFIGKHLLAAAAYGTLWYLTICVIDALVTGELRWNIGPGYKPFLVTGVWLYVVVGSSAYALIEAQRATRLEANAAQMQLDNLRTQLHPHFLFNALHTVVQLIPLDARAAVRAAEQLADVLRTAVDERRDRVPLAQEWAFVQRYLALERTRCGERLRVEPAIAADCETLLLPSFALQTLVENAVRHAVAPRVEATCLRIRATRDAGRLCVQVEDDGPGADTTAVASASGTGLRRLRERLRWLYGDAARLELDGAPGRGFRATLHVPAEQGDEHD